MKRFAKHTLARVGAALVRPHLPPPPPDPRTSPATKIGLTRTFQALQSLARSDPSSLPRLGDSGFRIFSQFEEDGLLLYLAAVLELENRIFLDIGASDGVNSNCANLALNLGWHGLFLEGDEEKIRAGEAFYRHHKDTVLFPPTFVHAFIKAENINMLVAEGGLSGDIGICSIDIDGNDCWVWQALDVVSPAVVMIETHIEFGMRNIAVPYDPEYCYPGRHPDYHGASPVAMCSLASKKGYRLVGANRYGFNLIFVRNEMFPERIPEVTLESILQHPRYLARLPLFEPIKDWEYVSI